MGTLFFVCTLHVLFRLSSALCLRNGINETGRKNITIDGVNMSLGIWALAWTSSEIWSHIFKIIAEEELGYHTVINGAGPSDTAIYVLAGCPGMRNCTLSRNAVSRSHLSFETWRGADVAYQKNKQSYRARIPESLGTVGYVGTEGSYVKRSILFKGIDSQGLHLDFYRAYNMSWFSGGGFFSSTKDIHRKNLKSCTAFFTDATAHFQKQTGLDYQKHFASDPDGVKTIVEATEHWTMLACKENDFWWLSPSCRANVSKCIPWITTPHGWGAGYIMQSSTYYNMPIAIGFGLTWGLAQEVVVNRNVLNYWWEPDDSFASINMMLNPVLFPPNDASQHADDFYVTMVSQEKLSKWSHHKLDFTVPRVHHVAQQAKLTLKEIKYLLLEKSLQNVTAHDVACFHLNRTHAWRNWLPRVCLRGEGIVDKHNTFVTEPFVLAPGNHTMCARCTPGRHSFPLQTPLGSRACLTCGAGSFSNAYGSDTCNDCMLGRYQQSRGSSDCIVCSSGSFAAHVGQTHCDACNSSKHTRLLGASSRDMCLCPEKSYYDKPTDACRPCVKGMLCRGDSVSLGDTPATTLPGFHAFYSGSMIGSEFLVFMCNPFSDCLGDDRCKIGLDVVKPACGECVANHYRTDSGCAICKGLDRFVPLVVCVSLVFVLGLSAAFGNRQLIKMHAGTRMQGAVVSVIVTYLQALSVLSNVSMEWPVPINSVVRIASVATFNLDLVRSRCVPGLVFSGAMFYHYRVMVIPTIFLIVAAIVYILDKLHTGRHRSSTPLRIKRKLKNTIGFLFVTFSISIFCIVMEPFLCYKHPTPGYQSVVAYPQILCWRMREHTMMCVVAVSALVLFWLPGVSACIWAVVCYPKQAAIGNAEFMRSFQFLFGRMRPDRFLWILIIMFRGLAMAVMPVIFQYDATTQIVAMNLLFICSGICVSLVRPWRTLLANYVDIISAGVMQTLLLLGAIGSDVLAGKRSTQRLGFMSLALLLFVFIVAIAYGLYTRFRRTPSFFHFICHHKADAGGQARVLQQLLQGISGRWCFLDSDHLLDLDALFDAVGSRITNLVVYLGRNTLLRPWCVGEIATAHVRRVHMIPVRTFDFAPLSSEKISSLAQLMGFAGLDVLSKHGIRIHDAGKALTHVQSLDHIEVPHKPKPDMFYGVANLIVIGSVAGARFYRRVSTSIDGILRDDAWNGDQESLIFIGSAKDDAEATSCAVLVKIILTREHSELGCSITLMAGWSSGDILRLGSDTTTSSRIKRVIMVLSNNVKTSIPCAFLLLHLSRSKALDRIVPVLLPSFSFPSECDNFFDSQCAKLAEDVSSTLGRFDEELDMDVSAQDMREAFGALFQWIGVPVDMHADLATITTEVSEVYRRLTTESDVFVSRKSSSKNVRTARHSSIYSKGFKGMVSNALRTTSSAILRNGSASRDASVSSGPGTDPTILAESEPYRSEAMILDDQSEASPLEEPVEPSCCDVNTQEIDLSRASRISL